MKQLTLITAICIFFLLGCEKEKINTQQPISAKTLKQQDPGSGGTGGSTGFVMLNAPLPISQLIEVPEDYTDEMFNMQLYRIARGFCNVAVNATLLSNTYTSLVTTDNDASVAIESLIQANAQYQSKIEEYTAQAQSLVFSKSKRNSVRAAASEAPHTYDQTVSLMTYQNIAYKPIIYVPNAQSADFSLKPIIAIGTDFAWPTDEYEDYIPGWKVNSDNSLKEVIIDSKQFSNIAAPVVIISYDTKTPPLIDLTQSDTYSSDTTYITRDLYVQYPKIKEYMIQSRFDKTNHSEYRYSEWVSFRDGSYTDDVQNEKIRDIPKDKIGYKYTEQSQTVKSEDITGINYMATFEYDLFTRKKNLPIIFDGNSKHRILCRMSKYDDWYQFIKIDWIHGVQTFISTNKEGHLNVSF